MCPKNPFLNIKLPEGGGSGDAQVNTLADFVPTWPQYKLYVEVYSIRGPGTEFVKFSNGPNTNVECFNLLN